MSGDQIAGYWSVTGDVSGKLLISVIIPTFGRPGHLCACLRALCRQDFPREHFEVIIVDDGGPAPLGPVVDAFRESLDVKLIRQENAGPAMARNNGAAHARAPFLAFTDDDCLPNERWLCELYNEFASKPDCLLGGAIVNALPENIFSSTSQMIQQYVYEYYSRRPDTAFLFNSNNMAASRKLFSSLRGFNASFPRPGGEDYEFCHRWHVAGLRTKYVPSSQVSHGHALKLQTFITQHFNYGRGLLVCRTRMGRREGRRIRLEAAGFYMGLVFHPFWKVGPIRGLGWCLLIGLSQAATIAGAGVEAIVRTLCRDGTPAIPSA